VQIGVWLVACGVVWVVHGWQGVGFTTLFLGGVLRGLSDIKGTLGHQEVHVELSWGLNGLISCWYDNSGCSNASIGFMESWWLCGFVIIELLSCTWWSQTSRMDKYGWHGVLFFLNIGRLANFAIFFAKVQIWILKTARLLRLWWWWNCYLFITVSLLLSFIVGSLVPVAVLLVNILTHTARLPWTGQVRTRTLVLTCQQKIFHLS